MEAHFNWTQLIPGVGHEYVNVATAAGVGATLIGLSFVARAKISNSQKALRPEDKLSVRGLFEVLLEFIVSVSDMVIGEKGRKFAPLFASVFTFVLFNNLIGLIPGMSAATSDINTTLAVGLFSFVVYNLNGIKEHGLGAYLHHFMGPLIYTAPLIFVIELVSHCVRPLSLGLRLMGNMTGDHTVLGIFLGLSPWYIPIPLPFYLLGLFVSVLQAFVFTLLSMVYVSMAIAHDH